MLSNKQIHAFAALIIMGSVGRSDRSRPPALARREFKPLLESGSRRIAK
jgi:hypothetical protein